MTACAAKFCSSAICLSVNGRDLLAVSRDDPEQRIILAQRYNQDGSDAGQPDRRPQHRVIRRFRQHVAQIGDMEQAFALYEIGERVSRAGTERPPSQLRENRRHVVKRRRVESSAVINQQAPESGRAKLCAFSNIASNTGARSPGEELMTCKTSAVAVCCSSASSRSAVQSASRPRSAAISRSSSVILSSSGVLIGCRLALRPARTLPASDRLTKHWSAA